MDEGRVVEAFRLGAGQLARAMTGVSAAEGSLPTRCAPWKVCDLLTHVRVVIAWLPGMLAAPAHTRAEVSAAEYYRPDDRFAPDTNAARIALLEIMRPNSSVVLRSPTTSTRLGNRWTDCAGPSLKGVWWAPGTATRCSCLSSC
ncbi:maleylpyruvate isomerase N-terminal domain-containing protein [Streptomyces sp. NPDC096198]|uniref:maleylpyruvate isomerase N-terminal domain-containing protein n=1 Tax=Streptomyces sp. NPDC096198 TaxID=3366080 RepID=UPI0038209C37